ncbi:hypothetical protein P6U16_22250 (plasmid) [Rhizobium sp. 32-5/1]|uniref:hypothetical protein n=1 Tax=Rhizobium sp. 32-5/1 TaxID=3019602 RepID=UPI00240CE5CF|nr:hypothetical protein [Rhizobium sp. 32-5/1]WEZ85763.1 hypothetical protein P6U16_22250 [Rhizobium sp. 32-5/1]
MHARLLTRIVVGDLVIDHETVTRTFSKGKGDVDGVCLCEIELGKIAKAWFKSGAPRMFPQSCLPRQD